VEKSICDSPGGALISLNFFELTTNLRNVSPHDIIMLQLQCAAAVAAL